eukprot:COSAG04_NODE_13624_length_598_cov_0.877756_2_plen_128_part_00
MLGVGKEKKLVKDIEKTKREDFPDLAGASSLLSACLFDCVCIPSNISRSAMVGERQARDREVAQAQKSKAKAERKAAATEQAAKAAADAEVAAEVSASKATFVGISSVRCIYCASHARHTTDCTARV